MCVSGWAIAAVEALQSQYNRYRPGPARLSVQQVLDCSQAFGSYGCDGGLPEHAYEYIKTMGVEREQAYSYVGRVSRWSIESIDRCCNMRHCQ